MEVSYRAYKNADGWRGLSDLPVNAISLVIGKCALLGMVEPALYLQNRARMRLTSFPERGWWVQMGTFFNKGVCPAWLLLIQWGEEVMLGACLWSLPDSGFGVSGGRMRSCEVRLRWAWVCTLTKGTRGCKSGSVSKLKKTSRFSISKPGYRELLGLRKQSFVWFSTFNTHSLNCKQTFLLSNTLVLSLLIQCWKAEESSC